MRVGAVVRGARYGASQRIHSGVVGVVGVKCGWWQPLAYCYWPEPQVSTMAIIVRELPPRDARRQGRTMYASGKVRGGFRVMYIGRDKVGTNTSTGKHKHKKS